MLTAKERDNAQTISDLQNSLEASKKEVEEANKSVINLKQENGQVWQLCVCIFKLSCFGPYIS